MLDVIAILLVCVGIGVFLDYKMKDEFEGVE